MAKALEILGYNVLFYCPLTNQGVDWLEQEVNPEEYDVVVDWSMLGDIDIWLTAIKTDCVICLNRDYSDWSMSMDNMGVSPRIQKVYLEDYDRGIKSLRESTTPFMELYITEKPSWRVLCQFLEKPIPDRPFPHYNMSDYNFRI